MEAPLTETGKRALAKLLRCAVNEVRLGKCPTCQNLFYFAATKPHTFCSRACLRKFRRFRESRQSAALARAGFLPCPPPSTLPDLAPEPPASVNPAPSPQSPATPAPPVPPAPTPKPVARPKKPPAPVRPDHTSPKTPPDQGPLASDPPWLTHADSFWTCAKLGLRAFRKPCLALSSRCFYLKCPNARGHPPTPPYPPAFD